MNNNETFKMTYSSKQQEEIKAIRRKYAAPEEDKMEQLRALDARSGKKATVVSVAIGVIGALLMGFGMSLVMTELGELAGSLAMPLGIGVGVVGIVLLVLAYPVYSRILEREKKKIAPQILKLTDELMK